jgi:hypothetical protein
MSKPFPSRRVNDDELSNTQQSPLSDSDPQPVSTTYYDSFLFNTRQMAMLQLANLHDNGIAATQQHTQRAISRVIETDSLVAQLLRSNQERTEYATRLHQSEEAQRAMTEQVAELQLQLERQRKDSQSLITQIQQKSSLTSASAAVTAASAGTCDGQPSPTTNHNPATSLDKSVNEDNYHLLGIDEPERISLQAAEEFVTMLQRNRLAEQGILGSSLEGALKNLTGEELYSNPAHFLHEFIQNADDSCYGDSVVPTLFVSLGFNEIIIASNEIGMRPRDVLSLCRIGVSTKSKNKDTTGHKGLGFKSVFSCTSSPKIVSGNFRFSFIEQPGKELSKITPIWMNGEDADELRTRVPEYCKTIFCIPLNKDCQLSGESFYNKLIEAVDKHVLLFTRKIKHIDLFDATKRKLVSYSANIADQTVDHLFPALFSVLRQPTESDKMALAAFMAADDSREDAKLRFHDAHGISVAVDVKIVSLHTRSLSGSAATAVVGSHSRQTLAEQQSSPMSCQVSASSSSDTRMSNIEVFRVFKATHPVEANEALSQMSATTATATATVTQSTATAAAASVVAPSEQFTAARVTFAIPFIQPSILALTETTSDFTSDEHVKLPTYDVYSVLPVCNVGLKFLLDCDFHLVASRENISEKARNTLIRSLAAQLLAQILGMDRTLAPFAAAICPSPTSNMSSWWRAFVSEGNKALKCIYNSRLADSGLTLCLVDSRVCPGLVTEEELRQYAHVKLIPADQHKLLQHLDYPKVSVVHVAMCFKSSEFCAKARTYTSSRWEALFTLCNELLARKSEHLEALCLAPMFARAPLEIAAPPTSDTLFPLVSLTDTSDLPPGRCFLPFHRAADDTDIRPWRAEFGMLQSRCTAEDHFLAQFAHITRATPALVLQAILRIHLQQQEPHGLGQTTVVWRDLSFIKDHFADYLKIKAELYDNLVKIGKLPESATSNVHQFPLRVPVAVQSSSLNLVVPAPAAFIPTVFTINFVSSVEGASENVCNVPRPVDDFFQRCASPEQCVIWEAFLLRIGCTLPPAPSPQRFARRTNKTLFPAFSELATSAHGTEAVNALACAVKESTWLAECFCQVEIMTLKGKPALLSHTCRSEVWLPQLKIPSNLERAAELLGVHISTNARLLLCAMQYLALQGDLEPQPYIDCLMGLRRLNISKTDGKAFAATRLLPLLPPSNSVYVPADNVHVEAEATRRMFAPNSVIVTDEDDMVGPIVSRWLNMALVSPSYNSTPMHPFHLYSQQLCSLGCHHGVDLTLAVAAASQICTGDTVLQTRDLTHYETLLKYIENLLRTMAHQALVSPTADVFVPKPNEDGTDSPFVNKLIDINWRLSLRDLIARLFKSTTMATLSTNSEPSSEHQAPMSLQQFLAQHLPLLSGEQKVLSMIMHRGNIRASISADVCFFESQESGSAMQMINWFITRHCPVLVALLNLPFFEEMETTEVFLDGSNRLQRLGMATNEFKSILLSHGAVGVPSALAVHSCTYFPLDISFGKCQHFVLAGSTVWLQSANRAGLATALLALLVRYCPLSRAAAQAIVDQTDFTSILSSQNDVRTRAASDIPMTSLLFPLTDILDGNFRPVVVGQPILPSERVQLGEDDVVRTGSDGASNQVGPQAKRGNMRISPGLGTTPTDQQAIIELQVRLESVAVETRIQTALQAQWAIPKHHQVPAPQLVNPIELQRTGRFAEIYMALWLEQLLGDEFVPIQNWVSSNRPYLFADLGTANLNDAAGFDFVFLDNRRLLDAPLAAGEIVVPRLMHLEVKGCVGPYNGSFFMSANEIAKRADIVQEAELVRQSIEQGGFLPGTVEPAYAVVVVEHCESLRSCSLAAIHILDRRVRLQQVATNFSVHVQPVGETDSTNQSRGPSDGVTRIGWSSRDAPLSDDRRGGDRGRGVGSGGSGGGGSQLYVSNLSFYTLKEPLEQVFSE